MTRVLISGGAGFIGSHLVEHLMKNTDWDMVILDRLTYAANGMSRLRDIGALDSTSSRIQFFPVDISYPISVGVEKEIGAVDYIVHLAAETHVDNSIADPRPFVYSNVVGTMEMLQFAKRLNGRLRKFMYMSTDEVFGPAPAGVSFKEWDHYNTTNPYSATKAAGEELCMAWANTYQMPILSVHCMNAFGERQHPEKFIPKIVKDLLRGQLIRVHADKNKKSGSRHYIHCRNIASAILWMLNNVKPAPWDTCLRDKYNITGEREISNEDLVKLVHSILQDVLGRKLECRYDLVDHHSSRPGHDLRYSLSGEKLRKLGWAPPNTFEASLRKTVEWMVAPNHIHWLMLEQKEST